MSAPTSPPPDAATAIGAWWNHFWFLPAEALLLAKVRWLAGGLALLLWWSYGPDLITWFGPQGLVSPEVSSQWRPTYGLSLWDATAAPESIWTLYASGALALLALTIGFGTPVTAVLAALFFASLLHRGPMLAGPADDVTALILWCLAIGRSGDSLSVDSFLAARAGRPAQPPGVRNRIGLSLLRVHASVLAAAAALAQLKGDVWWDGSAAWWLAARADSWMTNLAPLLANAEYLTNLLTHGVTLFEIIFALGVWIGPVRRSVAGAGLVAWPLIGLLAGEPFWGAAMAILALACLAEE